MTSSTSSFKPLFFLLLVLVAGCAGTSPVLLPGASPEVHRLAVLPFEELNGSPAPTREIRALFLKKLAAAGVQLIPETELEEFMARHRLRAAGGIDSDTATALKEEAGVDTVLISSVELYEEVFPPRLALTSRLVSTGREPVILWMEGVALAGDDNPGLLDLGVVTEPQILMERGAGRLAASLVRHLRARDGHQEKLKSFRPDTVYNAGVLASGGPWRVAVVPFFNRSEQRNGAEIMALHFVRELARNRDIIVVEPGVVREQLLKFRIIMEEGLSISDSDVLFQNIAADHILSGTLMEYKESRGGSAVPRVDFSAQLIGRKSRSVEWGSKGRHGGDDRVYFFDFGRISTAHDLAEEMVRGSVETMVTMTK